MGFWTDPARHPNQPTGVCLPAAEAKYGTQCRQARKRPGTYPWHILWDVTWDGSGAASRSPVNASLQTRAVRTFRISLTFLTHPPNTDLFSVRTIITTCDTISPINKHLIPSGVVRTELTRQKLSRSDEDHPRTRIIRPADYDAKYSRPGLSVIISIGHLSRLIFEPKPHRPRVCP